MRALTVLMVTLVFVFPPAAYAEEQAAPTNAEILKELRELRKAVDGLTKRVEALEGKPAAPAQDEEAAAEVKLGGSTSWWPSLGGADERKVNTKALGAIKLPENPTKDQVKKYVSSILAASRGQNLFSDRDPQVRMLMDVGPENLDVLIAATKDQTSGDVYVVPAIVNLAREEDKAQILKALAYTHTLAKVVVEKGWEEDAKDILLAELRDRAEYVPTEWVRAVANLQDPNTYDDLKKYLISGGNKRWTYDAIKDLPGIDLTDAVAKAWERAKRSRYGEADEAAGFAAEFGHVDALGYLIRSLSGSQRSTYAAQEAREVIMRCTDARGTSEQIRKWFGENKDKLVFDPVAKKYRVQEAK